MTLLAFATAGLMIVAVATGIRVKIDACGVVDLFYALITVALGFYLFGLGSAVVADASAAAQQHRTSTWQALAAIVLLYLAGGLFLGAANLPNCSPPSR